MDLDNVRVFTKVVRFGSLTRAAAALGVPKSTVSRRLAELETQLQVRLIQRTTRRLSLTDAGQRFYSETESLIVQLEAAQRAVHDPAAGPRGTLRISAPTAMAATALVAIVERFLRVYPDVNVVVSATNRRVDLVAEGIDVALRAGPMPPSTLRARRLASAELHLLASAEYLARRGNPSSIEELSAHECLIFDGERATARWTLHNGDQVRHVDVSGRCAMSDFGALTAACGAGLGIALLPGAEFLPPVEAGRLVRVLPDWLGPEGLLHAVYPSANQLSPTVRAFIEHAVEYFKPRAQATRV